MAVTKQRRIRQARELLGKRLPDKSVALLDELSEALTAIYFPETNPSRHQLMVGVLSRVMGIEPSLNKGRLETLASAALAAGYEPEEVERMYDVSNPDSLWCRDWRSGRGEKQLPSEKNLRETIKGFAARAERLSKPVKTGDL